MTATIHHGDCIEVMQAMESASVDSIVTDPPAGISFMGKKWDADKGGRDQWIAWMQEVASEAYRVLKPGSHALVWALPRTSHWTATAWENAGFEVRERIGYLFGSGFPKSRDISKAIDSEAGVKREVVSFDAAKAAQQTAKNMTQAYGDFAGSTGYVTAPATEAAKQWDGWQTALKPAMEDWWLLRKPLAKGLTVAANVLEFGTGGLNIDACRVELQDGETTHGSGVSQSKDPIVSFGDMNNKRVGVPNITSTLGRWPANIIHDGSDEVLAAFPQTGGGGKPQLQKREPSVINFAAARPEYEPYPDTLKGGSASRFFYCAKSSKSDRDSGLDDLPEQACGMMEDDNYAIKTGSGNLRDTRRRNTHATVKPLELMKYLCRLITPPGGTVLDMFAGSGSTGKAAAIEGFDFIGIEREAEYVEIARRRIAHEQDRIERAAAERLFA